MTDPQGTTPAPEDKPFAEIGFRIGRLLQESSDAATEMKAEAQSEARAILESARKTRTDAEEEAARLIRDAEAEAASIVDHAHAMATRVAEQSAHDQRLAQAEAAVERNEAHRQAKLIVDMANRQAQEIIETATSRSVEQARAIERRVRQLQATEVELRDRIKRLEDGLPELLDFQPAQIQATD